MLKRKLFSGLILGVALAAGGCMVRGSGGFVATGPELVVVEEAPPPPRVVVAPAPRPGYIWVDARWDRRGNQWAWNQGRWERQRVGHYWAPGRWERRNRGHVWVAGTWQAGGRDHQGNGKNKGIRDHRR